MHAEVIAIGDEITSGQTLDTNSQWLSQRLEELGIRVLFHTTVGDELQPCADVFRLAIDRADLVVITGGLGPTADDLTRDALAEATGRELVEDAAALEYIQKLFARRRRPMPEQNRRQALFPAGSRVIANPHGTAPGIDLDAPRAHGGPCRVFALPGVPAEMIEMWDATVGPALVKHVGPARMIVRRNIKCFGAGESQIESMLPDMIRRGRQPTVGITASQATIILRIAAEGASREECLAAIEPTAATIRQSLGTLVFGEGDDELQDALLRLLHERHQTLATIEWGTEGLVARWLGSSPAAGGTYRGGLVVWDAATVKAALDVEMDDAGDPPALAMAEACRRRLQADFGLAIGPFPAKTPENEGVRSASVALVGPATAEERQIPLSLHPALLTVYCAKQALNLVRIKLVESG